MPMAKDKSSTGLSIELLDKPKYYTLGNKVSGNVTLDTAQDFAIGSVSVEFYGRAKVYFVQSHGHGESQWRGRAPLFSQSMTLYEGFHTHKPGSFSWPFTFQIPTHPDIAAIKQSKHQWKEKDHFLSTEDYVSGHPMPPTFDQKKWGFGYRWHVFVEYVVKVEVKQADGARMVLPPSSRKATLPVLVKHVSTETTDTHSLPLEVQFTIPEQLTQKISLDGSQANKSRLQTQVFKPTVRSSRLLVWNNYLSTLPSNARDTPFSFREKTKQVLNFSSLPRYTFEISVSVPETIQLLEENSIPFVVSAIPVKDREHTTIQSDEYPDVRIDNISLSAIAVTYLRHKGPFSAKPTSYDIKLLDQHPVDYTLDMRLFNRRQNRSPGQDSTDEAFVNGTNGPNSIDLSTLPQLSVEMVAAKLGKQTEKPLAMSFNTYIIAREYKLKWKLELDVAGEKVRIQNEEDIPIKVLPPSREKLDVLMNDDDATGAQRHDEEDANEDQSDASSETQDVKGKSTTSSFIRRRRGKKTKEEEAAEEVASRDMSSSQPLQYQENEILPRYEQTPNDFQYRNEIDETPPRYENE